MHALTEGEYENDVPIWSRNGKAVYFASDRTGRYELWKQDISSSVSTQITQHGGFFGVESYDGRYLYYVKYFCSGIWRMPIDGGEEERIMNLPEPWFLGYWDISESGVYFFDVAASPRPAIKYYDFKYTPNHNRPGASKERRRYGHLESAFRATDALSCTVCVIRPQPSWSRTESHEICVDREPLGRKSPMSPGVRLDAR